MKKAARYFGSEPPFLIGVRNFQVIGWALPNGAVRRSHQMPPASTAAATTSAAT
ncbi:MAG: hypothetical protein WKG07_16340 [Hymenobacter sp.]